MAITYTESLELKEMAQKLKERYYLHLEHVDIESVYFAIKEGELPIKRKPVEITGITHGGIKQIISLHGGNEQYCIQVWKDDWDNYTPAKQEWLMFEMLYSIDEKNNGKIKNKDIMEYDIIAEYFINNENIGIKWRNKDYELPSLLDGNPLSIPLHYEDEDEENE